MSNKLQLGDIIQIIAPNDDDINERIGHIVYIDENKVTLQNESGDIILTMTDGYWDNESIEDIIPISRSEEIGFARQNNLLNGVWIDIYFNGDLPLTITGKITNLENDKIEITTFPSNDVIFIDFSYRGLPEELQISKIETRKAPDVVFDKTQEPGEPTQAQAEPRQAEQTQAEQTQAEAEPDASLDSLERKYKEIERQLLEMPDDEVVNDEQEFERKKEIEQQTRNYIFNADQIKFGDDFETITQMIDVPEEEKRYDIEKQLDDLLDDMLSSIPNAKRSDVVKNDINKMIQRFKQLREKFSIFNSKGYALMPKEFGPNHKPLISVMEKLEKQLYWMLPVVKVVKKIYNV
jgi:hypothetical protein